MAASIVFSHEQEQALQLAKAGHSFFLTGGAGTGKTWALQNIINELPGRLIICGASGLSCLVLTENLKHSRQANTVHSAFGLMDGRYSAQELIKLYSGESQYYTERRSRLVKASVLIIDEISMVSSHTLHVLNRLLQFTRDNNQIMGGIQRIFCGDFLQLPPIRDPHTEDVAERAIMGAQFNRYVPHKVELTTIQRTSDCELARAIRDVSCGTSSKEAVEFLSTHTEPLKVPDSCKLVLFGTRENVMLHNAEALGRLPGQIRVYKAKDSGSKKQMNRIMAEEKLVLKLGAPVMLIRNISSQLVNGLRGHVAEMLDEAVVVHFPNLYKSHSFKRERFTRYDSTGCEDCTRQQIPLMLCFAITVHKSQGLSVDQLEVHADDMFYPGLLAVAISRATSASGLCIKGVSARSVISPGVDLLETIKKHGLNIICVPDRSCCQFDDDAITDTDFDACYSDDEDEDDYQAKLNICPTPSSSAINSPVTVNLLTNQLIKHPTTKLQSDNNETISAMIGQLDMEPIYSYLEEQLQTIYLSTVYKNILPKKANGEIFSAMAVELHQFVTVTLRDKLVCLPKKYHKAILTMFRDMQCALLSREARKLGELSLADVYQEAVPTESPAGLGVLRRIGGRTVYLMRKETRTRLTALLSEVDQPRYRLLKTVTQCLQVMMTTSQHAADGKYPDTLKETIRRSKGGALVVIEDETFELFLALDEVCRALNSIGNGLLVGSNVIAATYNSLIMDEQLKARLILLLPSSFSEDCDLIEYLWTLLIRKFLPVHNNTFRRKLRTALQATKKLALRQKVTADGETSTTKRINKKEKKDNDVDSECRAKPCLIRRSKKAGNIRWVSCDCCEDWFHISCTKVSTTITEAALEQLEYYCMHCSISGKHSGVCVGPITSAPLRREHILNYVAIHDTGYYPGSWIFCQPLPHNPIECHDGAVEVFKCFFRYE